VRIRAIVRALWRSAVVAFRVLIEFTRLWLKTTFLLCELATIWLEPWELPRKRKRR